MPELRGLAGAGDASGQDLDGSAGTVFATLYDTQPLDHIDYQSDDSFISGLRSMHERIISAKEHAGLMSPAHFDPDMDAETSRGSANVRCVRGIWLDNDGGDLTPDEFARLFPNYRVVVWNTYSSTLSKTRWRAFIPTTQAMSIRVPASIDAVVFVDGLRFDLARRLRDRLTANGAQAILDWRWSGFPTSTASCKPLVSPVAHLLTGAGGEGDVQPRTAEGRIADHGTLRRLMTENGYVFDEAEAGKLWIETGTFDEDGHKLGARLAGQIGQGIDDAAQCILRLVRAGRRVRVVTDHGWLLVPGNLPKATLGVGLTEPDEKRTRYARLKPGATTAHAQAPWSWNKDVRLAMAPGASSFYAAYEYAHGGISPQECVVPVIDVEPLSAARKAEITLAAWTGLRLRVQASGAADLRVDLRTDGDDPQSSLLTSPRSLDEDGRGSMVVSDDYEGRSATLVVIDDGGRVLARRAVTVGT